MNKNIAGTKILDGPAYDHNIFRLSEPCSYGWEYIISPPGTLTGSFLPNLDFHFTLVGVDTQIQDS